MTKQEEISDIIKEIIEEEDEKGLNPETGKPFRHGEYYDPEPPAFDFIKRNREQAREERIFDDYIKGKYKD